MIEVTSSSHCSNIPRSVLPYGVLNADATKEQKQATANVLADHVRSTAEAFPPSNSKLGLQYRRGLCEQAVSCAVADDDYEDMQEEMVRLTFFAL